jgi:hypothetical protein
MPSYQVNITPRAEQSLLDIADTEVRYAPYSDYIVVYSINDLQRCVDVLLVFNAALDKDIILMGMG